MYNLVIPIVQKDVELVLDNIFVIKSRLNANEVVLIGPKDIEYNFSNINFIKFIDEQDVCEGLTLATVKDLLNKKCGKDSRAGWYFQQFLKMAYSKICNEDYYLVWDSDTVPLIKITFFNTSNRPYLSYREYVKFDYAYFDTISRLLPNEILEKKKENSFVTEHMFFNTNIMLNLIDDIEKNGNLSGTYFWEKIIYSIDVKNLNLSGFSEYETYASYIVNKYPNSYVFRKWNNLRPGRVFVGTKPSESQLKWIGKSFDTISIERYDFQFFIFKNEMINRFIIRKIKFSLIYQYTLPVINLLFNVRMYFRKKLKK